MATTANRSRHRQLLKRWHRFTQGRQILRAQLGFRRVESDRPSVCQGCCHYHGQSYGTERHHRVKLICGFYPYGWQGSSPCTDWQAEATE